MSDLSGPLGKAGFEPGFQTDWLAVRASGRSDLFEALNPKSDVGTDGIARRLDAQGIATTQPISSSDTGKEGRQSSVASPPRATSVFGLKGTLVGEVIPEGYAALGARFG